MRKEERSAFFFEEEEEEEEERRRTTKKSSSFIQLFCTLCYYLLRLRVLQFVVVQFILHVLIILILILILILDTCNSPSSYRQPGGRGQLLSRRYCTHSGWLFLCASRTASEFQGALAVSCKYFKQSKWPFSAAYSHAIRYIYQTYAQQDIRVCEDDHFKPPMRQFSNPKAL